MNPTRQSAQAGRMTVGIHWTHVVMRATHSKPTDPAEDLLLTQAIERLSQAVFRAVDGPSPSPSITDNESRNAQDWTRVLVHAALSIPTLQSEVLRFKEAVGCVCEVVFGSVDKPEPATTTSAPEIDDTMKNPHHKDLGATGIESATEHTPVRNDEVSTRSHIQSTIDIPYTPKPKQLSEKIPSPQTLSTPIIINTASNNAKPSSPTSQVVLPASSAPSAVPPEANVSGSSVGTFVNNAASTLLGVSPMVASAPAASDYFWTYPQHTGSATESISTELLNTPSTLNSTQTGAWPQKPGILNLPDNIFDGFDFGSSFLGEDTPTQASRTGRSNVNWLTENDSSMNAAWNTQTRTVLAPVQDTWSQRLEEPDLEPGSNKPDESVGTSQSTSSMADVNSLPILAPAPAPTINKAAETSAKECSKGPLASSGKTTLASGSKGNLTSGSLPGVASTSKIRPPSKVKSTLSQRQTQGKSTINKTRPHVKHKNLPSNASAEKGGDQPTLTFVQTPRAGYARSASRPAESVKGANLLVDMFRDKAGSGEIVPVAQVCRIMGYRVGKNGEKADKVLSKFIVKDRRHLFHSAARKNLSRSHLMLLDASRFIHLGVRHETFKNGDVEEKRVVIFLPDLKNPYYSKEQSALGWNQTDDTFYNSDEEEDSRCDDSDSK